MHSLTSTVLLVHQLHSLGAPTLRALSRSTAPWTLAGSPKLLSVGSSWLLVYFSAFHPLVGWLNVACSSICVELSVWDITSLLEHGGWLMQLNHPLSPPHMCLLVGDKGIRYIQHSHSLLHSQPYTHMHDVQECSGTSPWRTPWDPAGCPE